ncbi:DUF885 domain-containing protein [Kordiimonas aestuarii]|uniref:DUF885 domain-containing protein n=1 Tax=Kordiimonas aestuarii TaxID=1005925 RepID=UPI0021CF1BE5|nr:DUF885 domain-containing protein [Kordiimonas aestuarii]
MNVRGLKRVLGALVVATLAFGGVATAAPSKKETNALYVLFQKERDNHYAEHPGTGPRGKPRPVADRMTGVTPEDEARREAANKAFLVELLAIKRDRLSEDDQLNYDMFRFMIESRLTDAKYRTWRMPLYSDSGFHTWPTRMGASVNFRKADDYRAYIRRMEDLPRYLEENIVNMRVGMDEGFTMPKVVLDGLLPSFAAIVKEKAEDSTFYDPFRKMADSVGEAEQEALRSEAKAAIMDTVMPAYAALNRFMKDEYYPAARESIGVSETPGGAEYYEAMVRYYTTVSDLTAEKVHEIGLREVARIRSEMEEIIEEVEFEGSFADFLEFLRTDEPFYAKSPKELLMHASYIAKKIDGRLPQLFNTLPRQPYGVEPVPDVLAPNYTTGRYSGAPLDAPRGGYYWVNTYALDKRPLYTLPALTLHEAVPGHHLQIALSKELEDVPEFRLGIYPHAFGEGWGLYSERLGLEMDIYETPYERFGRLTYEMWRACRLVVDTGMHMKGWTRAEAIKLMEENSALSTHNIRTEVDRYISWPGQALAYKMGELKIVELREKATKALGDRFDVRAFHDAVLSSGGLPLDLLEAKIDRLIKDGLQDKSN